MKVYLDHNAGTPLHPGVLAAMCECLSGMPGNPSSTHQFGRAARAQLDRARAQVAALVGAHPSQVIFTSGGTEANNLALHAVTAGRAPGHLAVSAIEHPSVLEAARALRKSGWQLDLIEVDSDCRITPEALRRALKPDTRLVSVMLANNETGVIQPVSELAAVARAAGVLLHTDAVQAAGKIGVDFEASGAQLTTLSAHKIYGPKGAGALIVDKSLDLEPMLFGGGQERGLRAGTENLAAIVGFGVAAELASATLAEEGERQRQLRDCLQAGLKRHAQVTLFAEHAPRLPNTVQFSIAGLDGETLLMQLDKAGIAVSSGSACASGSSEPSHVLLAMGVDPLLARGAVRVSLGRETTRQDIDTLLAVVAEKIQWLNKAAQAAGW